MPKITLSTSKSKFDEQHPIQSNNIKIPTGIVGITRKIKSQITWSKWSKWSKNGINAFYFLVFQCFISLNLVLSITPALDFLDFFQTFPPDFRPKHPHRSDWLRPFRPTQTNLDQNWSKNGISITHTFSND